MKIIKIPVEGDIELKEIGSELKHLQAEVGGDIREVPAIMADVGIIVDEATEKKKLRANVRASMLMDCNQITRANCLRGDALLVLADPGEDIYVDFTFSNLIHIKRLIAARIKQHRDNGWMKG